MAKKKLIRRQHFLAMIDKGTHWLQLHELIAPFYPKVELPPAHALLYGDEVAAMGDAGFQGVEKGEKILAKARPGTSR